MGRAAQRNDGDVSLLPILKGSDLRIQTKSFCSTECRRFQNFTGRYESLAVRTVASRKNSEAGFFEKVADVVARDRIASKPDRDPGIHKFFKRRVSVAELCVR